MVRLMVKDAQSGVLVDVIEVRGSQSAVLECRCGERFMVEAEEESQYTWLEDHLEVLEGKEARQAYYERVEQALLRH